MVYIAGQEALDNKAVERLGRVTDEEHSAA
jgi:hypothetical protein